MKGITFKENVADIRNSKVADLAKELMGDSLIVDVVDPYACVDRVKDEYELPYKSAQLVYMMQL